MTAKIRYNYEFLQQFCKENGIELTKDYSLEKVNRDTIIEAKCLTEGCEEICSKGFREFLKIGCYCKKCSQINRIQKLKMTIYDKYGVDNISQVQEIKDKKTNTTLKNWGVENPFQSEEVKTKSKETCLEKYGFENPCLNKKVREKIQQTCLEKYGVTHQSKSEEIKQKKIESSLKNWGTEHTLQNKEIRKKGTSTIIEKYGVTHQSKSEEIKQKKIETSLKNWGTEHPAQNAEVSEKASKKAYKSYDYTFPSGRIERIQGYENFMLNDLLQKEGISEDDIVVKRSEVPSVWYEDANGKKRRYFVDCFIKSQNRCIEAKSTWTAAKKKDCIYLKQNALKDAGYLCEIWIYDGKGELVEKI